jgi:hypothetical protein
MTPKEVLEKATARPWNGKCADADGKIINIRDEYERLIATFYSTDYRGNPITATQAQANSELSLLAVNSYESNQALIGQLVEALEDIATIKRFGSSDMARVHKAVEISREALAAARKVQP